MSGIAGQYSLRSTASPGDDRETVCRLLDRIQHRGTDGLWLETGPNICLGLVDLESNLGSTRARHYSSAGVSTVMDGQVYNLPELTGEDEPSLASLVELMRTRRARDLFPKFNGEFALAAKLNGTLILARDPVGIKPLFWTRDEDSVYFASEIKALQEVQGSVEEFPPGHYWVSDKDRPEGQLREFASFPRPSDYLQDRQDAVRVVRESLEKAVELRMRDGRIKGMFLSGGLDSSIIAALAVKHNPQVHTFTVGMEGSQDLKHARMVADHLNTTHHEHVYDMEEMLEYLPEIIYYFESYDSPTIRSCIANYFATRIAQEYTEVVLSGEGSDELFAGYEHMLEAADSNSEMNSAMVSLVDSMRFSGLQRMDRMTAFSGAEVRMPFLDPEVIQTAVRVPSDLKVDPETGTEKWILRLAFEDLLPREVVYRAKSRFSEGAGSSEVMEKLAASTFTDQEYRRQAEEAPGTIKSKEELLYYRLYRRFYPDPELGEMVTRWRD